MEIFREVPEAGITHQGIPKKLFSHVKGDEELKTEGREVKKLFVHIENEDKQEMKKKLFTHLAIEEEYEEGEKELFTHIKSEEVSEDKISCKDFVNLECGFREPEEVKPTSSMRNEQNVQESPEKMKEKLNTVVTEAPDDWKNFYLQLIEKILKIFELPDGEEARIFYRFKIMIGTKEFEKTVSADEVSTFKWVKSGSQGIAFIRRGAKSMSFDEYISHVIDGSNPSLRIVYAVNQCHLLNF